MFYSAQRNYSATVRSVREKMNTDVRKRVKYAFAKHVQLKLHWCSTPTYFVKEYMGVKSATKNDSVNTQSYAIPNNYCMLSCHFNILFVYAMKLKKVVI